MTTTTFITAPTNASDTYFRAWGGGLSTALTAVDQPKTSDTGQIDWATVTTPTAINTSKGYEIRRFNDSAQSTVPVVYKIEYGSGNGNAGYPSIWITIGTGSDGAGNITGILFPRTQLYTSNNSTTTTTSRVTGASNRIVFQLWITSYNLTFSLERTHLVNGTDTTDGLLIFYWSPASSPYSQYLPFTGTLGTLYNHWNCSLPPTGTGVVGANTHLYPVRTWGPMETCPSVNVFLYFNVDLTAQNVVPATMWDGSSISIHPTATGNNTMWYGGTGYLALRAD